MSPRVPGTVEEVEERLATVRPSATGLVGSRTLAESLLTPGAVAFADLLAVATAIAASTRMVPAAETRWSMAAIGLVVIGLVAFGLYSRHLWDVRPELSVLDELPWLLVCGVLPAPLIHLGTSLAGIPDRPWAHVSLGVTVAGALVVERTLLRTMQRWLRRRGVGQRPTLIVGAGHVGSLIARRLLTHPELGLRPVGFVDKEPLADADERSRIPVLGKSFDLPNLIDEYDVKMVVMAFSTAPHDVLLGIVRVCQRRGVELVIVPRLFETVTTAAGLQQIRGVPMLGIKHIRLSGAGWWLKRASDVVIGSALLCLAAPVLALAAMAIRLDTPGSSFYRQERAGRDGKPFMMLKFRTLVSDAERQTGAMWSDQLDSDGGNGYVTRIGRLLRKTSLDELPQLVNVVRGDMSLVGPRPERPMFVDHFVHDIYRYGDRMRVKAGMTGWAQVHGLKGSHGTLVERVEYDNYYIENWSPWLDAKIFLLTIQQIYRDLRGIHDG